jgi:hypothetical protein
MISPFVALASNDRFAPWTGQSSGLASPPHHFKELRAVTITALSLHES